MILEQVPTEWFLKNYIEYDEEKVYISLKSPKEVVDYFKDIDDTYYKDNGIHLFLFDKHSIRENVKIDENIPKYMSI